MYCMYFPVVETERHITVNIFILWHYCSCKRVKTWNISPRRCAGSSCSLGIGGWTCCSRLRTGGRGSSRRNTCIKLFLWKLLMIHFFTYPTRAMKQQQMTAAKYKLGETVELFTIYIRHFNLSMMASSWRRWPRTPCSEGSWWRRGGWWRRTRAPWNWEGPRLSGVLNSFVMLYQSDISI